MVDRKLILKCKENEEESIHRLIHSYKPLINKYSYIFGIKDEDLNSELIIALLKCVKNFSLDEKPYIDSFLYYSQSLDFSKAMIKPNAEK